jgi:hypothetical protein
VLSEDQPVFDAAIGLVLFPLDKLMSLVQAMRAPFDGDYDVRWGPLGAFVGCTVPWVTLIPYIYPPPPLADVVLQREDFERLLERLHVGDGIAAYREIIGNRPGCADLAAVRAVRISDRPPSARPTAMAPSTRGSIRCWRGGEHR